MFRRLLAIAALGVIAFSPAVVAGQSGDSTISGVVKDQTGAVLPGAAVRAINESTGASVETVTDGQGAYRTSPLPPGAYRVEAVLDGFELDVRRVTVEAGQAPTLEITLAPARFSQSVVVTARRVEELAQEVPIPVSVIRLLPAPATASAMPKSATSALPSCSRMFSGLMSRWMTL